MKRIALLSDTHNYLDPKIIKYFDSCDEIWHGGDIGTISITDELAKIKPTKAVYGNIDGQDVRKVFPKNLIFRCEEVKVLITHIGGYPGRFSPDALEQIKIHQPQLFICGHSHILKVMFDQKYKMLCMNPGAAGIHGFHKVKTMLHFTIDGKEIKNLEAIEFGARVG
jgi:putative phosphoesterase